MEAKQEATLRANVRFPASELERIDAAAQGVGMNRSDYIRYLVRASGTNRTIEVLVQLAEVLRRLQVGQRDYLRALTILLEMAAVCEEASKDKAIRDIAEVEIPVARELCAKLFSLEADVSRVIVDLRTGDSDPAVRKA